MNTHYISPYSRLIILYVQPEINRAPAIFIMNPTSSIRVKETPFTPPKANPFTPVAMGLIKALVQERVIIISTSKAERPSCCASGRAMTKKTDLNSGIAEYFC